MTSPVKCKCGAEARIREKEPYIWVECKRKCGMRTGYFRAMVWDQMIIDDYEKSAIFEWNRLVNKTENN